MRIASTVSRLLRWYTTGGVLAVLTGACTAPAAPEALVGDYPLATVAGAELPQFVGSAGGCTFTVVDGMLSFRQSWPSSGSGDWSALGFTQAHDCRAVGGDSTLRSVLYLGSFLVEGDALRFETLLSDTDTLRWQGRVDGRFLALTVLDSIRSDVIAEPMALRFGPRQPIS